MDAPVHKKTPENSRVTGTPGAPTGGRMDGGRTAYGLGQRADGDLDAMSYSGFLDDLRNCPLSIDHPRH